MQLSVYTVPTVRVSTGSLNFQMIVNSGVSAYTKKLFSFILNPCNTWNKTRVTNTHLLRNYSDPLYKEIKVGGTDTADRVLVTARAL